MPVIEKEVVRAQALNAAREQNAVMICIREELRVDMPAVGAGDYASLPEEFQETFALLDSMVAEGLFTREPFPNAGVMYSITDKGREAS